MTDFRKTLKFTSEASGHKTIQYTKDIQLINTKDTNTSNTSHYVEFKMVTDLKSASENTTASLFLKYINLKELQNIIHKTSILYNKANYVTVKSRAEPAQTKQVVN